MLSPPCGARLGGWAEWASQQRDDGSLFCLFCTCGALAALRRIRPHDRGELGALGADWIQQAIGRRQPFEVLGVAADAEGLLRLLHRLPQSNAMGHLCDATRAMGGT